MASKHTIYTPLDDARAEIRLLTIKLSEDTCNQSRLELEFYHVPLMEVVEKYDALSYTWGDVSDGQQTVQLNGHDVQVRANLYNFLIRYREWMLDLHDGNEPFDTYEPTAMQRVYELLNIGPSSENKARTKAERNFSIWIDALCINQDDVAERNQQVPRMKDIYEKAQYVIVWLGKADPVSDDAMKFLHYAKMKLNEDREMVMTGGLFCGEGQVDALGRSVVSRLGLAPDMKDWQTVADLFDRPYWKRMWVVQELAFSYQNAWVWCGRKSMSAHIMAKVQREYFGDELGDTGVRDATQLRYDPTSDLPKSLLYGGPWPMEVVRDLSRKPVKIPALGTKSTREIMSVIRTRKATDPKDMIYAMYGNLMLDPNHTLTVDYGRTTVQVYCDFIQYEITMSKALQIWQLLTDREPQIEGLPSWAVDWTSQDERHHSIHIKSPAEQSSDGGEQHSGVMIFNMASLRNVFQPESALDIVYAAGDTQCSVRFMDAYSSIAVKRLLCWDDRRCRGQNSHKSCRRKFPRRLGRSYFSSTTALPWYGGTGISACILSDIGRKDEV